MFQKCSLLDIQNKLEKMQQTQPIKKERLMLKGALLWCVY